MIKPMVFRTRPADEVGLDEHPVAGRDLPMFPDLFTEERRPRLLDWAARSSARPARPRWSSS